MRMAWLVVRTNWCRVEDRAPIARLHADVAALGQIAREVRMLPHGFDSQGMRVCTEFIAAQCNAERSVIEKGDIGIRMAHRLEPYEHPHRCFAQRGVEAG